MICRNCGKEIIPAHYAEYLWRHKDDQMFTCSTKEGLSLKNMETGKYLIAEPKEEN